MQPQDFDQPPAPTGTGLQPPAAPQPLQPLQPTGQPQLPQPTVPGPLPPAGPLPPDTNGFTPNPYNGDGGRDADGRKRKLLLVAGVVLGLIVIAAVVALVLAGGNDKHGTAPKTGTSGGAQDAGDTAITSTNPQFFFTRFIPASMNQELVYVDAVSSKQTKHVIKLNDGVAEGQAYTALHTASADTNDPLQLTSDGSVIAYATVRIQPDTVGQGEVLPGSFSIMAGPRTGAQQPILAGKDVEAILDWRLSADGKTVYYLEAAASPPKTPYTEATLYSVNVNTGQNNKLGVMPRASDRTHSKLFEVPKQRVVRFYSSLENGMYQATFDLDTKKVANDVVVGSNQYAFGGFGDLSPDGKHLMYTGNPGGASVVMYRIGVDSGEVQTIFEAADSRIAYSATSWSADSKNVLITTYPYAAGQQQTDFKYQLISYDVTTNKQTKLAETTAPGLPEKTQPAGYGMPRWSPDKKYVAYAQGGKLYLYGIAKNNPPATAALTLPGSYGSSDAANGWIRIPAAE